MYKTVEAINSTLEEKLDKIDNILESILVDISELKTEATRIIDCDIDDDMATAGNPLAFYIKEVETGVRKVCNTI